MNQRDGDGGGPSSRGGSERSVDGGSEGGREDGGDVRPGRRVGLSRGSDSLGGSSGSGGGHDNSRGGPSGGGHNDNGGRGGSGCGNNDDGRSSSSRDDDNGRLRARVAALVVVNAIADVDARTAGDTDIDTGAGAVVIT